MKQLIQKYKHSWVLSYFFIYMIWFFTLEKKVTTDFTVIHTKLDDIIPFNEWFVIPYYIWFLYIFVTVAYFFLTSREDYYRCIAFLFIGMTICLIIYTIFPNGQNLRPDLTTLGRSNFLIDIVAKLYGTDTPTNVFPSIHVFNSIGAYIAIHKSVKLKKYKILKASALILTILICLSTMFLKQHSALDAVAAIILSIIMYRLVYGWNTNKVTEKGKVYANSN